MLYEVITVQPSFPPKPALLASSELDDLPIEQALEDDESVVFGNGTELEDRAHVPLAVDTGEDEAKLMGKSLPKMGSGKILVADLGSYNFV